MSDKFEKIKGYAKSGLWTALMVYNVKEKGYLTDEEYNAILDECFDSLGENN